ncbi:MAG: 3-deoxy-manno-octulosonate cytidylyltransferase [Prevotellaceae bacterium]|nr:3-deoxy-manno-octulosonate cytidylyltransferase [Prevotellaceae bacterium]
MRFLGIIPARYASTRFPGKPLADISGKTMIRRVYEGASEILPDIVVATDDRRIFDAVSSFGGNVLMTSENHHSGTDRCFEAYTKLQKNVDVIINIQGDEPEIHAEQIKLLQNCFTDPQTEIASLAKRITQDDGICPLSNPNHVKTVIDRHHYALYFSRSVIPHFRRPVDENEQIVRHTYYKHIGLYAYRSDILAEITQLPPSSLEQVESLEQLRWLENGYKIKIAITDIESIGIDTPEDLKQLKKRLRLADSVG